MANVGKLEIINDHATWIALQEQAIISHAIPGQTMKILEAGCGRSWSLDLEGAPFFLTGIDYDKDALAHRLNVRKDLDEGIVTDLTTATFDGRQFDLIYNCFVLEHIQGAESVMRKFVDWLRPGGLMIIQIPDPDSVHGFVTRLTPHWFHVLYYRFICGFKDAGKPGFGPYRTYYETVVSRQGMAEFCSLNGLRIRNEYGGASFDHRKTWRHQMIGHVKRLISLCSLGFLSARHDHLLYIIAKK